MTPREQDMLMAYVDGELDEIARGRAERLIAADPEARQMVERQQALKAKLALHFEPLMREPLPPALVAAATSNVVTLAPRRPRIGRLAGWASAAAAMLVAAFLLGRELPQGAPPPAAGGGILLAAAPLDQALERDLAAAPRGDVRIGVTFRSKAGDYCRTFQSASLDGIACRRPEGWALVRTAAVAPGEHQYQQAGSPDAGVMETAERMMSGSPFDAAAERQARDAGWRSR